MADLTGINLAMQTPFLEDGSIDYTRWEELIDIYLDAGYPIASGVIEGACRHVVKDRMERTGMRWTILGAQAMLNLRCVAINDQWDEFTQFRIQRETQRLYPQAKQVDTAQWPMNIAA